jgi:hypothetical protein
MPGKALLIASDIGLAGRLVQGLERPGGGLSQGLFCTDVFLPPGVLWSWKGGLGAQWQANSWKRWGECTGFRCCVQLSASA